MTSKPKTNPLDKRIPENPKYRHVKSSLDTGNNMRKVLEKYEGTSGPNARARHQDEFFTRLKGVTLAELLGAQRMEEESIYRLDQEDTISVVSSVVADTDSGLDGNAEGSILLLDLRAEEDYDRFHIVGAKSYPVQMLSRATNYFTQEIYRYRGPVDGEKMIIVYDNDGKIGPSAGNQFVEKGIENVYVLSGGLKEFAYKFPQFMLGDVPPPPPSPAGSRTSIENSSARLNTAASKRTTATNLSQHSVASSTKSKAWK